MERFFSGLAGGGKAYFVLEKLPAQGTIVVVTSEDDAPLWRDNLAALGIFFSSPPVHSFLSSDLFGRIRTLRSLAADPYGIVVATPESLAEQTLAPSGFQQETFFLEPGQDYDFNRLMERLSHLGYVRSDFVEERGQFSRRGEILDIWPPDQDAPWRIVFSHNTLESLRSFDVVTQRSERFLGKQALLPVQEKKEVYLNEYLAPQTFVYMDIPGEPALPELFRKYDRFVNDPLAPEPVRQDAGFKAFQRWGGNFALFSSELKTFIGEMFRTVIFCSNQGEKERIEDILLEQKVPEDRCELMIGPLAEGFYSPERRLAIFSSQEILYKRRPVSFPKLKTGRRLEGLWEITPGDYVVHEKYGIGRYLGLKKLVRGEQASEYLAIEYKGGDKLYVPPDDFRVVQKYVGVEGYRPRLFSLDTFAWERAKQRAREGAQEMAEELLKLYAARRAVQRSSYGEDTHWERELADSFPYQETEDQMKAITDVKGDLRKPNPMERLICGDVGFGKTEVAIRAAFKVLQDSRQVAVLVPTTVLAEQHFQTFSNRLAPFPVRVALLSRFQSTGEQKKVVNDLQRGNVDIVVGTHRLLQKDIRFHDLGLLVIDEEHRFGVKQKEKIKQFKKNVDVLLMSATPIPRTLSLALSNLRDISVIETPPYGRLPIETHLGPYDEKTVKKIIQAELSRGGQVFYVHNRVETIFSRAQYLKNLLPGVRWGVIHGQMPASDIEKTMWDFLHRKLDVLMATTIIESGLDIPSVNTMVIEEAENFGLAQLYQLRGRIGREKLKAYCYLFYTPSLLTEESRKRLQALQEFGELGSGFRLALRDLEIRGAGNILSARQHGFAREIGFELYSRLLDEASKKLSGLKVLPQEEETEKTVLDFSLPAYLPGEYVEAEDLRITFYRRLANARTPADLDGIRDELQDRFGALPGPADNLMTLAEMRLLARKAGISSVLEEEKYFALYFRKDIVFTPDKIVELAKEYGGILEFIRGETPGVRLKKEGLPQNTLDSLKTFLGNIPKFMRTTSHA